MSYFKTKMYPIQFRLGLCPRPHRGAYSTPQTPTGFKRPTSKGQEGKGWESEGKRGERGWGMERSAVWGKRGREGEKGRKGARRGHPWFLLKSPDIKSWIKHCSVGMSQYVGNALSVWTILRKTPISSFYAKLLTDRQKDRQTNKQTNTR